MATREFHRVPTHARQVTQSLYTRNSALSFGCAIVVRIRFLVTSPVDTNCRIEDVARPFNKLAPSLGFEKGYIIQGDVRSKVARVVAAEHAACKAAHINFCIMPERKPVSTIDELEAHCLERAVAFSKTGSAYALEHATCLNTIDFALPSNPIALLDRRRPAHRCCARVSRPLLDGELHLNIALPIPTAIYSRKYRCSRESCMAYPQAIWLFVVSQENRTGSTSLGCCYW
jgi:hypothetical protein